jgi:hypothetical protein
VGPGFLASAPVRHFFARNVPAGPETAHRALAEDVSGRPERFAGVRSARPARAGPEREFRHAMTALDRRLGAS